MHLALGLVTITSKVKTSSQAFPARYANNGPINNQQSTIAVPTSCHNGARCVLNIGFRMASLPADGAITYWHLISRVAIASPERRSIDRPFTYTNGAHATLIKRITNCSSYSSCLTQWPTLVLTAALDGDVRTS